MARKGTLTVRVLGDTKPFEKAMSGLGRTAGKVGKGLALGGAAIAGATAAIGVGAVKAFADFDAAMTQSTAIMGDVSEAMRNDMSKAAREVAKTTKFSAAQAAESYFFLASAGLDAQQSMEALPQVAKFAQAGMFDMALATDLATDAQSALGLKSEDAQENLENLTRVTDVLVKANTLANASVEQFATALTQKAGGALRNVGKDIEEGAAVLSVFADQGIKAERAGTILRATLDGLSTQARKNADAFAEYNVQVFDGEGNMRNMADIVADLEDGLEGMSTEAREAALAQLGFNRRSREGLLALLGNSEALRNYERDLRNAAGTTDEVANKQMQTFWAKLGLVKDQLIDVGLSLGQTLMPALEGFADWLSGNLPAITGWFEQVSTKFMDLMGVGEESTEDVRDSLSGMESDIAKKATQSQQHLEALVGTTEQTASDMEGPFEDMGKLMGAMWDAWTTVWQQDVQPWFHNSFIPWFETTAAPEMKHAGGALGIALVNGILEGLANLGTLLLEALVNATNSAVERFVGEFNDALDDIFFPGMDVLPGAPQLGRADLPNVPVPNIPNPVADPSPDGGGGGGSSPGTGTSRGRLQEFHNGGIVPGPPTREVFAKLLGGEVVTNPARGQKVGGDTNVIVYGRDDTDMAGDVIFGLKMAAQLGA